MNMAAFDKPITASFDLAEISAILAGLRLLQGSNRVPAPINEIMTNGGDINPLSLDEIDALCERINGGDM